jgi:Mitochondrial carrier protein
MRTMATMWNIVLVAAITMCLQLSWISVESYVPTNVLHYKHSSSANPGFRSQNRMLSATRSSTPVASIPIKLSSEDDIYHIDGASLSSNSTMETLSTTTLNRITNRRQILQSASIAACAATFLSQSNAAWASVAEIDKSTGSLYSPKKEMMTGGSAAARGVELQAANTNQRLSPGKQIQTVYETRFIAYLSRFLLNFDDAASAWWKQNTEDAVAEGDFTKIQFKFAEFAESVEIGLADYFVGPYGSYSSLSAMKAGISAKQQAKSRRYDDDDDFESSGNGSNLLKRLFQSSLFGADKPKPKSSDRDQIAKQGVLNLYTLLKARYTSRTAKKQLAILFSFFSNPNIQPTAEIRSLLGEVDNATITKVDWIKPISKNEATSRTSSRRGGGYSVLEPPTVTIEAPPALGSAYQCAKAVALLQSTSRVLRIKVLDGGQGYTSPPDVYISSSGVSRQCIASAIIDREGHVEEIVVLDPGYGYGRRKATPPNVVVSLPKQPDKRFRPAVAKAELEYEIVGIGILENGNGYVATEPPQLTVSEPLEDPDWFVDTPELDVLESEYGPVRAEVAEMMGPKGNVAYSKGGTMAERTAITPQEPIKLPMRRVWENPTELLPSALRPELNSYGSYVIPSIAAVRTYDNIMDNPRFRAVDPLFGAIGTLPAQKAANELKSSEYARLALSGAVCTVLVRTALNPLELIKTKLQLENDEELISFARQSLNDRNPRLSGKISNKPPETSVRSEMNAGSTIEGDLAMAVITKPFLETENNSTVFTEHFPAKIGSKDMILSLVKLRGPGAVFQSADITFLASLVFGSLGFGATELFRRSFTLAFFMGGESDGLNTEIVLLLAATVATIITSAAAAPFELLRVRSMGLVEPKPWPEVMKEFLKEKLSLDKDFDLELKDLKPQDVKPLWQGFGPTASRELAFAIPKFLAFDIIAKLITGTLNSQLGPGALPIQVGVGGTGLAISAFSGALAGIAGAIVSHPADLILTRLSASRRSSVSDGETGSQEDLDWKDIVKEILSKEGGAANLFVGLVPRIVFFFLVIGLQFFLYDYVKNLLQVGSDDLSLVLDVFYAVRQGLVDSAIN